MSIPDYEPLGYMAIVLKSLARSSFWRDSASESRVLTEGEYMFDDIWKWLFPHINPIFSTGE